MDERHIRQGIENRLEEDLREGRPCSESLKEGIDKLRNSHERKTFYLNYVALVEKMVNRHIDEGISHVYIDSRRMAKIHPHWIAREMAETDFKQALDSFDKNYRQGWIIDLGTDTVLY